MFLGIAGLSAMASAVYYLSSSNKQQSEGVVLNKSSTNIDKTGLVNQSVKKEDNTKSLNKCSFRPEVVHKRTFSDEHLTYSTNNKICQACVAAA